MSGNIQNLREFLTVYNWLTSECFATFNERRLNQIELDCINKCGAKAMNVNRRVMQVFSDIGPEFMQRAVDQVLVAVYGPHECRQRSKKDEERAIINCQYSMAVFSTNERKNRPRGDRKSSESSSTCRRHSRRSSRQNCIRARKLTFSARLFRLTAAIWQRASTPRRSHAPALPWRESCPPAPTRSCPPTNVLNEECEGKSSNQQSLTDVAHNKENSGSGCARLAILPRTSQIVLMELEHRVHMNNLADLIEHSQTACQAVHERMTDALTSYTQKCATNMQWN